MDKLSLKLLLSIINGAAITLTLRYPEVCLFLHTVIIICSSASEAVYSSREKEISKSVEIILVNIYT